MKMCLRYQPSCLKNQKALALNFLLLSFLRISQANIYIIGDDKEVIAGETVDLVCELTGGTYEVLQVDWMRTILKKPKKKIFTIIRNKDATPEEENGLKDRLQFSGSIPQGIGNIRLQDARLKDVGTYSCHFFLSDGRLVTKSIHLKIQDPPQSAKVTPLESPSSSPVSQCEAYANPRPVDYTWTRNGLPLSNNGFRADGNKLSFQEISSDMNGHYDCEVSNKHGSTTGSLQFYVHRTSRLFCVLIPFTMFLCFLTFCIFYHRSGLKSSVPTAMTALVSRGESEDTPQELQEQKPSDIEESEESSQLQHTSQSLKELQEGSSEQSSGLTQKDAKSLGEET